MIQVKNLESLDGGRGKRFKAIVIKKDAAGHIISSKIDYGVEKISRDRYRTKNGQIVSEAPKEGAKA